jgi:hypothetical protein
MICETLPLIPLGEQLPPVSEHWCISKDGDAFGYQMYRRHYSCNTKKRVLQRQFIGPGRKLVLLGRDGKSLFAWRKFIDDTQPKQTGYNCAVFRNEGDVLSSVLIRDAVKVVFEMWGRDRCYTFVDPSKIRSENPGCCFKKAGWIYCGMCKSGKLIFNLEPCFVCGGDTVVDIGRDIPCPNCQSTPKPEKPL